MLVAALAAPAILAGQQSAPDLSDPQVAHVAVTANSIDVELARFAQTRSRNDAVLEFAATMIRDHTTVNQQAAALAERLHLTPADNRVSQSLSKGRRKRERAWSRSPAPPSIAPTWTGRWPTIKRCWMLWISS
jgi:putative membrane protein